MPITRSDLVVFSSGLALGAVACVTFPKWKGKVAPLVAAAMAGATAACNDASARFARNDDDPASAELHEPAADLHTATRNGVATSTA